MFGNTPWFVWQRRDCENSWSLPLRRTLGIPISQMPSKNKQSGARKDTHLGCREMQKPEPEKQLNRSPQRCKPQTPKNRKTGARKKTHLGCQKVQKPEPEKKKNWSPQRCKPRTPKGGKTGAQKIAKPEPKNYQIRYLFPSPCLMPTGDEQDISTATGPFPPIFLANYIV